MQQETEERYTTSIADQILYMDRVAERIQQAHGCWKPAPETRSRYRQDCERVAAKAKTAKPVKGAQQGVRDRPATKQEWTIEYGKSKRRVVAPKGLPYSVMDKGEEIWIDAELYRGKRFKVRNHIPGARFVRLDKERDGKAHIVVRRDA